MFVILSEFVQYFLTNIVSAAAELLPFERSPANISRVALIGGGKAPRSPASENKHENTIAMT